MKWRGRAGSQNIEDRRGMSGGGMAVGGGLGGLVLVLLISALTGQNPADLINTVGPDSGTVTPGAAPADDPQAEFVGVVLADTEMTWERLFDRAGQSYEPPVLVLFTGATQSACGLGQSAMGPFYCPADRKVYLDLSFFRELDERFGAPGDFAQAYVVAHEIGHHVQTLTGVSSRVQAARQRAGEREGQCTLSAAGVAGRLLRRRVGTLRRAGGIARAGDAEEGLRAAAAIGDDRLQRQSQGTVVPESFTHGSSEQRVEWLRRGLQSGSVDSCNTF